VNKKILIISYYWPPSGGSGVQRWLKFVKYLPQFGWKPHVFTPENPSFAIRDESLLKDIPAEAEVIRFPIWEPYDIFFKISGIFGKRKTAKPTDLVATKGKSGFQFISTWIRGNLFIPDPRRFWVRPSVKFLESYLEANQITRIVTTGPPHSLHLIGRRLKQRNSKLYWIADFRDPWSAWGFLDTLNVGTWARKYHKRLESSVLQEADEVVTITPFYKRHFEGLGNRKVTLLTNGFDEDDFQQIAYTKSGQFIIRHMGIINEKCDPRPFMLALKSVCVINPELAQKVVVEFYGDVHPQFRHFVEHDDLLKKISLFQGSVPHKKLMQVYGSSSLLVLILTGYKDAEGYMPGKLFEYLATGLPILGVGPVHGDAGTLLQETGAGQMIASENVEEMKRALLRYFIEWKENPLPIVKKSAAKRYSRREITRQLSELLEKTGHGENTS
jgi:glycosyltransferase involved in cell wall biosynthesis